MPLLLDKALLRSLEFDRAVKDEVAQPADMLPSRAVEVAISGHESEFAGRLVASLSRGYSPDLQEIVWAPKGRYRHRPISALGFRDRCILRALTQQLVNQIPSLRTNIDEVDTFEQSILTDPSTTHVVIADIASFYQYVDHDWIEQQIIDQSGDPHTAEAVVTLLEELTNRAFGIPQGVRSSDVLAELAIQPIEARLVRSGLEVARFNDDFRIAVKSEGAGRRALQLLQDELYPLGMTLNEEKSQVLDRLVFEERIGVIERRMQELLADAAISQDVIDLYSGHAVIDIDPEVIESLTAFFYEMTSRIIEQDQPANPTERLAARRALLLTLAAMRSARIPDAASFADVLIHSDPSLSRPLAMYLAAIARSGHEELIEGVMGAIESDLDVATPDWQTAWLFLPLLNLDVGVSKEWEQRAVHLLQSAAPTVLRARAAVFLYERKRLPFDDLFRLFEQFPSVSRPDLVAAMVSYGLPTSSAESRVRAATRTDKILEWIADYPDPVQDSVSWLYRH